MPALALIPAKPLPIRWPGQSLVSPAWKQKDQAPPIRKGTVFPEHAERLRRLPGARHPTKPHAILPAAIEPDYRSREYLLRGTHFTIFRAPCFHFLGIYGVDRIIIASRPNRVVMATGASS